MKIPQLKYSAKIVLHKAMPVGLIMVFLLNYTVVVGVVEYYVLERNFHNQLLALARTTKNPEELVQILKQEVLPQKGYVLGVTWNDIGKQLLDSGVINKQKYEELLSQEPESGHMIEYLTNPSNDHMLVNEKNIHFMVNTLWAVGLINKSTILDEGQMKTNGQGDSMQYASTGGWTLGSKSISELYSSQPIIQLTDRQETLVKKIADTVYRPCCSNPVSFPDCNHGMASLGYIELGVKQGLSEKRIYQDLLALNSYWFPQQYVNLAAYFNKQKTDWSRVDAKLALSQQYSSAQRASIVQQQIQTTLGLNTQGGGCSA